MADSYEMSTSNTHIKYHISVYQNSQNVANNTSNVTVHVHFWRNNIGYASYGTGTVYCKINGTTYSAAVTPSQRITENGITLFSKTLDIPHNADGTKTLNVSAWIQHQVVTSSEQAWSYNLTTIPRASTPTLSASSTNMGNAVTINIARASSSFTHTLKYTFGSASGTIGTGIATSKSWTIPLSLANQIPNSTSGTGVITCETYNGSTLIGTKTVNFTAVVPSNIVPTITSIQLSDPNGYAAIYGGYVQQKSQLKIQVNHAGAYGSTVKTCSITWYIQTVTTNPFTTNILYESAGDKVITVKVTDSRGRTATATAPYKILEYKNPTINVLTASRCDEDGVPDDGGDHLKISYSATISRLNNLNGKNILLRYKPQDSSTWTNIVNVNEYEKDTSVVVSADIDKGYQVSLVATDTFGSNEKLWDVSTAFTLMDFNKSGKGMAIGKVSEQDAFEVAMDAIFKSVTTLNGANLDTIWDAFPNMILQKDAPANADDMVNGIANRQDNAGTNTNYPTGTKFGVIVSFNIGTCAIQFYASFSADLSYYVRSKAWGRWYDWKQINNS